MRPTPLGVGLVAVVLTALTGCGGSPGAGPSGRVVAASAAGGGAVDTSPPATAAPVATAPPTSASPTTLAMSNGASAATAPTRSEGEPYAPEPPPAGVEPDGYGGYGGTATATGAGTAVALFVYPRESYLGEPVQVRVSVEGTTAVRSLRVDLGDGDVYDETALPTWGCPQGSRQTWGGAPAHTYAAAGVYRITVTVTAVPCSFLPGPPGIPGPWVPNGADQVLSPAINLTQRPDHPPPPVGPPPGP